MELEYVVRFAWSQMTSLAAEVFKWIAIFLLITLNAIGYLSIVIIYLAFLFQVGWIAYHGFESLVTLTTKYGYHPFGKLMTFMLHVGNTLSIKTEDPPDSSSKQKPTHFSHQNFVFMCTLLFTTWLWLYWHEDIKIHTAFSVGILIWFLLFTSQDASTSPQGHQEIPGLVSSLETEKTGDGDADILDENIKLDDDENLGLISGNSTPKALSTPPDELAEVHLDQGKTEAEETPTAFKNKAIQESREAENLLRGFETPICIGAKSDDQNATAEN